MEKIAKPTSVEMEELLQRAVLCLDCDAPDCFEFTPEGVAVCSAITFWKDKPVTRGELLDWYEQLRSEQAVERT